MMSPKLPRELPPQLLHRIAAEFGTPTYVYSADLLNKTYQDLDRGLRGIDHRIFFAVKSNSNLSVLRLLHELGAGFDVVSGGELFRAIKSGAAAEDVVFSGVGKTPEELLQSLEFGKNGIHAFNVESEDELRLLSEIAARTGRTASVAFRFNPDVDSKTHPYISTGLRTNKFGLHRAKILELARRIEDFPGIRVRGLSIHIGSQLLSLAPIQESFIRLAELNDELNQILSEPLAHLDIGGGLGIRYRDERPPSIRDYCALIRKHLIPKLGATVRILLEPGRLIAGNSGILLTQALYWKKAEKRRFLIVDAAMNDLIRPALYQSHHEIVPLRNTRSSEAVPCDIVGPVCETGDFIARDRTLPSGVKGGDFLAILSAGAYGFAMSSNYNSRPRAAEVLVTGSSYRLIRKRETFTDLIRQELT